ncbi:MAG: GNAT family N-acetyltransferase [Streptomyces sp.]|nr:GNAT family N-acetyltransferase [Streptomyces sp.]
MAEQELSLEIVRAREEHVPGIAALARSRSLDGLDVATARRDGFLVSDFTEDTYRGRLTTAEHFYVALKGDDLLGFLLAYSDDRLGPDEWLNHKIKTSLGSFLVIKQVCVATTAARQGVASRLYHHVLGQWSTSPVIAAVVAEPVNEASTSFHRRLGFDVLTELTPPDGRLRTVWVWRKPREAMLQAQYSVAVDLYKHEDTTNWNKLNNFFYVTAALAAATGFAFGNSQQSDGSGLSRSLVVVIAVIGLGASIAFSQMLRWGRHYLQARKKAVAEIEQYLVWHGGQRVVSVKSPDSGKDRLLQSPTGLIMMLLPVLVGVCWIVVLVLALVD